MPADVLAAIGSGASMPPMPPTFKMPLADSAGALAHAYGLSPGIQGRVFRSAMSSMVSARVSYVSATLRRFALASGHVIDAPRNAPSFNSRQPSI